MLAKRSLLELSLRTSEWDAAGLLARELVEDYCALNAGQAMAAQVMRDLGLALWRAGELAEAELRAREALQLQRAYLPPLSPELGDTLVFLGQLLLDDERPEEAEALLFEALATLESNRGLDHLGTLRARALYGRVLAETGRAELAGSYLLDAWTRLLAHAGEEHEDTRMALELVRAHYARTGQPEPAALGEGGWLGLRSSP